MSASFQPINNIHQHLAGYHCYAEDRTRIVEAHHYCAHTSADGFQCVIYDSPDPNARLIGVEYVVSERIFKALDPDEKKYWHSHKYEVESGLLCAISVAGAMGTAAALAGALPKSDGPVPSTAEFMHMKELHTTYGKTFHFWQIDKGDPLPLGPPKLMMAFNKEGEVPASVIKDRDAKYGIDTMSKKEYRATYLDLSYQPDEDADHWMKTGKAITLQPVETNVKGI
ncbi:hypothetical protein FRC03_006121 [Tulasnella sp. 419]|nr:hypothetical protein FRC03_006121 [Tulasnella sp. 419]